MYTGTNQSVSNTTQQPQQTNAIFNSLSNTIRQAQQQQQLIQANTAAQAVSATSSSSSSSLTPTVAAVTIALTQVGNMLQQESNAGNLQFNSGGAGGGSGPASSAIKLSRESSLSLNEQQQRKIEMLESRFAPFSQQKSVSQDFSNHSLTSQDEQKCDVQMSLLEQVCLIFALFNYIIIDATHTLILLVSSFLFLLLLFMFDFIFSFFIFINLFPYTECYSRKDHCCLKQHKYTGTTATVTCLSAIDTQQFNEP
jgi:hypothetical protein